KPFTDYSKLINFCLLKQTYFKGFFRRTINERESQRYTCRNGGNCAVTGATRNNCKSCRYRRCLAVGMSKHGSRIGRQPNAIKHRCAVEIEQIRSAVSNSTVHSKLYSKSNCPVISNYHSSYNLLSPINNSLHKLNDSLNQDHYEYKINDNNNNSKESMISNQNCLNQSTIKTTGLTHLITAPYQQSSTIESNINVKLTEQGNELHELSDNDNNLRIPSKVDFTSLYQHCTPSVHVQTICHQDSNEIQFCENNCLSSQDDEFIVNPTSQLSSTSTNSEAMILVATGTSPHPPPPQPPPAMNTTIMATKSMPESVDCLNKQKEFNELINNSYSSIGLINLSRAAQFYSQHEKDFQIQYDENNFESNSDICKNRDNIVRTRRYNQLYLNSNVNNDTTTAATTTTTTDTIESSTNNQYKKSRKEDKNKEYLHYENLQLKKEPNQWNDIVLRTKIIGNEPQLSMSNWNITQEDDINRNNLQQFNSMVRRIDSKEILPTFEANVNIMNENYCILDNNNNDNNNNNNSNNELNEIHNSKHMKIDEIMNTSSSSSPIRNNRTPRYSSQLPSSPLSSLSLCSSLTNSTLYSTLKSNCCLNSIESYNLNSTIDNSIHHSINNDKQQSDDSYELTEQDHNKSIFHHLNHNDCNKFSNSTIITEYNDVQNENYLTNIYEEECQDLCSSPTIKQLNTSPIVVMNNNTDSNNIYNNDNTVVQSKRCLFKNLHSSFTSSGSQYYSPSKSFLNRYHTSVSVKPKLCNQTSYQEDNCQTSKLLFQFNVDKYQQMNNTDSILENFTISRLHKVTKDDSVNNYSCNNNSVKQEDVIGNENQAMTSNMSSEWTDNINLRRKDSKNSVFALPILTFTSASDPPRSSMMLSSASAGILSGPAAFSLPWIQWSWSIQELFEVFHPSVPLSLNFGDWLAFFSLDWSL
ncbi:unnamed protein product, partial [Schistosoma mattheei]